MISSPASAITPKQELARLTLESEEVIKKVKRGSTIGSAGRPSLGHIDSQPVQGPLLPPVAEGDGGNNEDVVMSPIETGGFEAIHEAQTNGVTTTSDDVTGTNEAFSSPDLVDIKMTDDDDNFSEATLVSRPTSPDAGILPEETPQQQKELLENKENLQTKEFENIRRSQSPDKHLAPLTEVSRSVLNSQAGVLLQQPEPVVKPEREVEKYAAPPGKPPPVPPRPKQAIAMNAIEEYARQQDVTEVINHCLFQLSCAMRPLGTDQDGEQLDEIHNLFFGQVRYHDVPDKGTKNVTELFSSIITRLYDQPKDIYDVLDTYFDLDEVDNGRMRFASIANTPPVIAVQLDRVIYDIPANTYRKLSHHVELKETIFLDRYLEDDDDSKLMERRKQTWGFKKDLREKENRRTELAQNKTRPDVHMVFEDAKNILEGLQSIVGEVDGMDDDIDVQQDTVDVLDQLAQSIRTEYQGMSAQVQPPSIIDRFFRTRIQHPGSAATNNLKLHRHAATPLSSASSLLPSWNPRRRPLLGLHLRFQARSLAQIQ